VAAAIEEHKRYLAGRDPTDIEVLPDRSSREIFEHAREPKKLIIYPGGRHGPNQRREELDRDLLVWLHGVL
jgi:alpha-beta hydrolase superfamily lysophospholipase